MVNQKSFPNIQVLFFQDTGGRIAKNFVHFKAFTDLAVKVDRVNDSYLAVSLPDGPFSSLKY